MSMTLSFNNMFESLLSPPSLFFPILGFLLVFSFLRHGYFKKAPLPPGPKPIPFIGNLHQLPKDDQLQVYTEWGRRYGDVVYMHIFGKEFVILNSLEATTDLFEKRSRKYGTRPRLVMAGELIGREQGTILWTKYGQRFKECRKVIHGWINPKTVVECLPIQEVGSLKLLKGLLESPERFSEHIRMTLGSVILKLTYGIDTLPLDDPYISKSEELSKITAQAVEPGRWLVDSFPIRKLLAYVPAWFPGAKFKRWAADARKKSSALSRVPYDLVKNQVEEGRISKSWTADQIMTGQNSEIIVEDIVICAAGSLYAGGIDTVVSLFRTFFLMMARHPEVQKKAQAEIDSIVGTNGLPGIKDKDSLPYIECLIKECFRINPIVPVVLHSLDEDDIYRGWRIPKGAWVMANMRALLHDPEAHKDPTEFRPERFEKDLIGDISERDPSEISFGFGRRFCPGYDLAKPAIFLNITRILATFDISPIRDENGISRPPEFKFDVEHISAPSAFKVMITPRDRSKITLITSLITGLDEA